MIKFNITTRKYTPLLLFVLAIKTKETNSTLRENNSNLLQRPINLLQLSKKISQPEARRRNT